MVVEYKDDPGAPGPNAYTAAEKRARALSAQGFFIVCLVLMLALVAYWVRK